MGQRFIVLISQHPYFELAALGASPKSAGKAYKDAVRWKQATPIPKAAQDLTVTECRPESFQDCVVVFSGLDSDVAGDVGAFYKSYLLTGEPGAQYLYQDL